MLSSVTWTGSGDGVSWSNAANWSDDAVPSSSSNVTISIPASSTVALTGSPATIASLDIQSGTLAVEGNGTNSVLTTTGNITNDGTIAMYSLGSSYSETVIVGGTFANEADGTVAAYNSGTKTFQGTVVNLGTVSISNYAPFVAEESGGNSWTEGGNGTITVDTTTNSTFQAQDGAFNFNGGAITGGITLMNAALSIGAGSTGAAGITLLGSDTLTGNIASGQTLAIVGNPTGSNATLTTSGNVTNDGTVQMFSLSAAYTQTLALGGTLTNKPDGTIQTFNSGTKTIEGTVVNLGTVSISNYAPFIAEESGGNSWTEGGNGTITVDTTTNSTFQAQDGAFNFNGGTITGGITLTNTSLSIGAGSTGAANITLLGNNTLSGNIASAQALYIAGTPVGSNGTLTTTGNVTNDGTIGMYSLSSPYTQTLLLGGTLTNKPDGTIQTFNSGTKTIEGTVVNLGTVSISNYAPFVAEESGGNSWTEGGNGTITVDTTTNSTFQAQDGAFNFNGGTITGGITLTNTTLSIGAGSTGSAGFTLLGSNTFSGNIASGQTLSVEGNGVGNNAALTTTGNVNNDGTIAMFSIGSPYAETVTLGGTFTNEADGTVAAYNSGTKSFTGNVVNFGVFALDTSTSFSGTTANDLNYGDIQILNGTTSFSGESFTNKLEGLIGGTGSLSTSSTTFTNLGDEDLSSPSVVDVTTGPSVVYVTYDTPNGMNVSTVTNPANYTLVGSGGDGIFGNGNDINYSADIASITFNSTTQTAALALSTPIPVDLFKVSMNGSAIADVNGNLLDGGQTVTVIRGPVNPSAIEVTWTGDGDGQSWTDPNNWQGDVVPGSADEAIINAVGTTVNISTNITVASIYSAAKLNITGSLSVTSGTSSVSGSLVIANGASLSVSGASTSFTDSASATIDGASLYASTGATLSLPGATGFTDPTGGPVTWQASGSGSEIILSGLNSISNVQTAYYSFAIQAQSGGEVSLPSLSSITNVGAVPISATGASSVVNLPALTSFFDTINFGDAGSLTVSSGGTINDPLLTTIQQVALTITDPGSQMNTSQLSNSAYGSISVDQTVNLNGLTDIDSTSLYVSNGATISIPNVTGFSDPTGKPVTWQASGSGSEIILSGLNSISNVQTAYYSFAVQAQSGGEVSLPALTSITTVGNLPISATGASSVVNLPVLTSFLGINYIGDVGYLNATSGGKIIDPSLTTLQEVDLVLTDPGSQMNTSQLSNISFGSITVDRTVNFNGLTHIDATSLYVTNGATISLPNVTSFSDPNGDPVTWQSSGPGGDIVLGNLASIGNVTTAYYQFTILTQSGGEISLPALARISNVGNLAISSTGTASVVNIPVLTSFTSINFGNNGYLGATGGGQIIDPSLTTLQQVSLTLTGTGSQMNTSQLTNISFGSITVDQTVNFNGLTQIDATSLYVSNGATISLPSVTSYSDPNRDPATWQSSGAGSEILLSNLTGISNVPTNYYQFTVTALSAGEVSLPALSSISNVGFVSISATGAGSLVNMPALSTFSDTNNGAALAADSGGQVVAGAFFQVSDVQITFDSSSSFVTQNLSLTNASTLYGSGTFSSVVNNAGTVGVGSGTLDLTGGGSGTGGTYTSGSGDTLQFGGGTLTLDSASSISGAGSVTFSGGTVNDSGAYGISGSTLVSGGTASLIGSASITGQTTVSSGTLNLNANAATIPSLNLSGGTVTGTAGLTISGSFGWSGGILSESKTLAQGGISFTGSGTDIVSGGTLNNSAGQNTVFPAGGTLHLTSGGNFTNVGNFTNQGTIAIDAPSVFTISGTFTQNTGATLSVQIGGSPGSGNFGVLHSTGTATLGGTFAVSLANGFAVTPSNYTQAYSTYVLATFPSYAAAFAAYNLPTTLATIYTPEVNPQNVSLEIQGVPTVTATAVNPVYNGLAYPNSDVTPKVLGLSGGVTLADGSFTYGYFTSSMTSLASAPSLAGNYYVVVTWSGDSNFASASSSPIAFSISKASPTLTATGHNVIYSGTADPASYSLTGVAGGMSPTGIATLTYYVGSTVSGSGSSTAPVTGGTYTVVASYAGDTNYAPVTSAASTFVISPATPTLTFAGHNVTYSGTADPATYSLTGVNGGLSPTGTVTLTYYVGSTVNGTGSTTTPVTGGTYTVVASYVGDANYTSQTSSPFTFIISPATPTLTVTGHNLTYSGSADAASYSLTGVNGGLLPTGAVTVTYYVGSTVNGTGSTTVPITAGTYTAVATYVGDANYTTQTSSPSTFIISKAAPTLTVTGHNATYTGSADSASYALTGVAGGLSPTGSVTLTYYVGSTVNGTGTTTAPITGGTYTVTASYAGDSNYSPLTSSASTFTISQATPTLTVTGHSAAYTGNPDAATYSLTGVEGGASPTGSVTLTYYVGSTVSGSGTGTAPTTGGTYTVVAGYAGDTDYSPLTSTASTFSISQVAPTLTVTGLNVAYSGTADAASYSLTGMAGGLSPTGSVTLTYYVGATVSGSGSTTAPVTVGTYTVVAAYAGDANYASANSSASTFSISKAAPTSTATGHNVAYTGNADPASYSLSGVAGGVSPTGTATLTYYVGVTVNGTGTSTAPVTGGTYTVVASYPGDTNYTSVTSSASTFTIGQATPTLTVTGVNVTYTGTADVASYSLTGVAGALSPTGTLTLTYYVGSAVGGTGSTTAPTTGGTYTVVASYAGDTNYSSESSSSSTFTISPATPTLTVTGHNVYYNGAYDPASYSLTGVSGGVSPSGTVTLTYYVGATVSGAGTTIAPINAGTYTVVASYPGDANYTTAQSAPSTFVIAVPQPLDLSGPAFYLRLDPDGQHLDVWDSATDTAAPSQSVLVASISSITVSGVSSGTALTVDFSNGDPLVASGMAFVGSAGAHNTLEVIGTPSNDTALVTANSLIESAAFGTGVISYSNTSAIIFNGGTGNDDLIQSAQPGGGATLSFAGSNASDTLIVNSGTYVFGAAAAGSGIQAVVLGTLEVGASATVSVAHSNGHANRTVLVVNNLTLGGTLGDWTGALDLQDNDMIVGSGTVSSLTNQIAEGYANGDWNGAGITSSAAGSDSTHLTALGIEPDNNGNGQPLFGIGAVFGLFDGQNPSTTSILIKYTYYGDSNLDGKVDGTDYARIDNGYLSHLTGWFNGDFNNDGSVNGSDYTLIDNAFNTQGASLAALIASPQAVPTVQIANPAGTPTSQTAKTGNHKTPSIRTSQYGEGAGPALFVPNISSNVTQIQFANADGDGGEPSMQKKDVLDVLSSAL